MWVYESFLLISCIDIQFLSRCQTQLYIQHRIVPQHRYVLTSHLLQEACRLTFWVSFLEGRNKYFGNGTHGSHQLEIIPGGVGRDRQVFRFLKSLQTTKTNRGREKVMQEDMRGEFAGLLEVRVSFFAMKVLYSLLCGWLLSSGDPGNSTGQYAWKREATYYMSHT